MKKLISSFIVIVFLLNILLPSASVIAANATENYLIKVGTGNYALTVTADTTIDEIISILGTPKLRTQSPFGGYAYTFYTDDSYSNYLYVETLEDGRIVSYGSVDPTYQTQKLTYGEENPYIYGGGSYLYGRLCSDPNDDYKIKGGVYYNKSLVKKADYENAILNNPTLYLKEISKQATIMYSALSTNLGNKTNFIFDEKLYDINREYKEKGSDIGEFLRDANIDYEYINLVEDVDIDDIYSVLNPMSFAYKAVYNLNYNYIDYNYAIFDYDCNTKIMECFAIDENTKNIFYNNNASDYLINEEDVLLAQNISYALSLVDDNMTDQEKAYILAQYVQEGNIYGSKGRDQTYEGVFLDHAAVCAGYTDAYKYLLNCVGIPCDEISSRAMNHAWNLCLIDGKWTYVDTQKSIQWLSGCARSHTNKFIKFKSKSDMSGLTYKFSDAILNNEILPTIPEGETLETNSYISRVYYDSQYKYYIDRDWVNVNGETEIIEGLYKENRISGERTLLATPLVDYDNMEVNIVKDGNEIYFVGQDAKSIYSIKTDGTNEKLEYKTTNTEEYIGGVYVSDGYICYATYYPNAEGSTASSEKENRFKKLNTAYSDYKIYTLNNDNQQYRLIYTKNEERVTIIKCIGIGNNLPTGKIHIPNTVDGLPVVGIADYAFNDTALTGELIIPDTVEYIGKSAFSNCKNINSVKLGKNLKSISRMAFYNCKGINQNVLVIPEGVSHIGDLTFYNCNNLQSIIFPSTLDIILEKTLKDCSGLKDILIKNENMLSMNLDNITADIYLPSSTATSELADEKGIEYIDSRTIKPTITLSEENVELNEAETKTITYDVTPKFYFAYPTTYTSSDNSVVTVNSEGMITAVTKGTATINVTIDGVTKYCTVNIKKESQFKEMTKLFEPTSSNDILVVLETKAELKTGEKVSVIWKSNNPNVVNPKRGYIYPVAGGFATLTAEHDTYGEAKLLAYVSYPITLSSGIEAYAGDLNNDYTMDTNDVNLLQKIVESNNITDDYLKIADINGDQKVDTEDVELLKDIVEKEIFNVVKEEEILIEQITIGTLNSTLEVGDTTQINVLFSPSNYTVPTPSLIWSTNNSNVATVNNGIVTAIGGGTATITAETSSGLIATCVITVKSNSTQIEYKLGDVNNDGKVNIKDWNIVYNHINETSKLTDEKFERGDVNKDGKVNIKDWNRIYDHITEVNPLW